MGTVSVCAASHFVHDEDGLQGLVKRALLCSGVQLCILRTVRYTRDLRENHRYSVLKGGLSSDDVKLPYCQLTAKGHAYKKVAPP